MEYDTPFNDFLKKLIDSFKESIIQSASLKIQSKQQKLSSKNSKGGRATITSLKRGTTKLKKTYTIKKYEGGSSIFGKRNTTTRLRVSKPKKANDSLHPPSSANESKNDGDEDNGIQKEESSSKNEK